MKRSIHKSSLLGPLYRGLPIVALTILGGIFTAKKYFKYATPQYESTAKIKLADPHEGITDSKLYKDVDVFVSTNKLGAEVELLKSKVLVRKAIANLPLTTTIYRVGGIRKTELYTQTPFLVKAEIADEKFYDSPFSVSIYRDSLFQLKTAEGLVYKGSFNYPLDIRGATLTILANDAFLASKTGAKLNDNYQFNIKSQDMLVNSIINDLDVMSVDKDVPVLRISYKCPVPQKAADIVNSLAKAYIRDYIDQKYKSADTTEDFLNGELKTYSGNLTASENNIEDYRNKNNIINIQQETETDLRKIADLKKQLANVKMSMDAADSLYSYMQQGKDRFLKLAPNYEEFTDLLSTEMVKKIEELQRDKEDLLLKYTPANERVKVVDVKLQDIFNYFQESIKNSKGALHIKYNELQKNIDDAQKAFVGLPGKEKNMSILNRDFGLNEEIYRSLHEKRTEAQIAKAATISFHRIISEGEVPTLPVSPNKTILTALATILGMFAGVILIYTVHGMKGRINGPDNISRNSDTPICAMVPFLNKAAQKRLFFKEWIFELELKNMLQDGKVITLSSFDKLEGKSFITNGIYKQAELLEKKILLIDAAATAQGKLEKPTNWNVYIQSFKSKFDVILIKNFALQNNPAGMMVMAVSDLNLFVVDSRRTKATRIDDADLLKTELNLQNFEFILNRAGYIPSLFGQFTAITKWLYKTFKR